MAGRSATLELETSHRQSELSASYKQMRRSGGDIFDSSLRGGVVAMLGSDMDL